MQLAQQSKSNLPALSRLCIGSGHFGIFVCWFGEAFEVGKMLVGRAAVGRPSAGALAEVLGFAGAISLTERGCSVRLHALPAPPPLAIARHSLLAVRLAVEVGASPEPPGLLASRSLAGEDQRAAPGLLDRLPLVSGCAPRPHRHGRPARYSRRAGCGRSPRHLRRRRWCWFS